MLRRYSLLQSQSIFKLGLCGFCRWKSDDLGWENIKSIRANEWPILNGSASADGTKKAKSNYLKKRIVNTVPK